MHCKQIKFMMTLIFFGVMVFGSYRCVGGEQLPKGWFADGSYLQHYDMAIDRVVAHGGKTSGYIKSKVSEPKGFGSLMQMFKADVYRGKRLRMSGYVKAEKVENWAGLWMRVDGPENKLLSFDDMRNRSIKGTTDWRKYEIVLDVPENSTNIAFGILLVGNGQAWVDDLQFEAVENDVSTTGLKINKRDKEFPKQPRNLDFEG